ncbi:hypothetical protein IFM89_025742 [Coptis chinensis]|uniref:CNH domain-containing protein n=1 Tax=Coptis chinensis TaxID=261450 RepID=A0A835I768_9MAGN|nr:hypothetical protein IFM89_025742 [Coptis chinensis]
MGDPNKRRTIVEPISELLDPSSPINSLSISTISNSQTLVYIGTTSGTLLLFTLNQSDHSISFTKSVPVTTRSIDSIHVIILDTQNIILLLSDGYIFSIDSHLLTPLHKFTYPKGVNLLSPRFGPDNNNIIFNDNNKTGRRFFEKWKRGISGEKVEYLSSGNNCNCLVGVTIGKRILLIEVVLPADVSGKAVIVVLKEIQCVDGIKSMVWINDSIIAGTGNGYMLFSCVNGQSTTLFSLPDPSSSSPYLKCLGKECEALLLVDNVGIVVNAVGEPLGGSFIFQRTPTSVAEMSTYLVAVNDGRMDLYHKKTGLCVQSVSFAEQGVGPCIVANEESRNGEVIVVASPSKVICFRKIGAKDQIKDLLRKKRFEEAIALVEELEVEGEMTKEMLSYVHAQVGFLLLFNLHFEEAVNHFLQSETMQPSEIFPFILPDPNRWSMQVPRNRYWGLHPPPVPLEDVIDDGLNAIQRAIYLRKAGVEAAVDEYFLMNPPNRANLLESAIENIIRYLRLSRDKALAPPVREGVDTLLMYLYRALNLVEEMELLASSENNCVVEELETLLEDSVHLRTLAFLYASKQMSSKALAVWRILAKTYSSRIWEDPSVQNVPQVTCADALPCQKTAAIEASKLLEVSTDQEIVLQHLGWVADVDHSLAVQILTSENRATKLSPEAVIAAIDPKKVDILQRYLKWLIEDQGSDDAQFHTLYALSLANSALEDADNGSYPQRSDARTSEEMNVFDVEWSNYFKSSVRERLQLFLQSSDLYDPDEVLDLIEGSEFWLEKAILYRKLGQETLVLQILALKLEDSEAAEKYCVDIGRQDAYKQLLDMYLDPQDGKEPMFKAALRLLHNHGESLDPQQILEVVHNLSRAINIDSKLARLGERSRNVQINDESLCDSCHARLGTKLFAMYPDDTIVCYKCFRRQGESTSVTGRNFKQDIIFKPGWLISR